MIAEIIMQSDDRVHAWLNSFNADKTTITESKQTIEWWVGNICEKEYILAPHKDYTLRAVTKRGGLGLAVDWEPDDVGEYIPPLGLI